MISMPQFSPNFLYKLTHFMVLHFLLAFIRMKTPNDKNDGMQVGMEWQQEDHWHGVYATTKK